MRKRSADSPTAPGAAGLALDPGIAAGLRGRLPAVAELTVAAVTAEVPGYAGALSGEMGANIEQAVQMALGGFLRLAEQPRGADASTPLQPAREAAYALGRGEARSGRTMDALLAAYRVGARVAWRELSAIAVEHGLPAPRVAKFAELVFAYIDELSAASVAGHADELAAAGRVRRRYQERLAQNLVSGAPADVVIASAERAEWPAPRTLTALLVPSAEVARVLSRLDPRTLELAGDQAGLEASEDLTVLLVPDADGARRPVLMRTLRGRPVAVGPARPWAEVRASYLRAVRAHRLFGPRDSDPASGTSVSVRPLDTDELLPELVLGADTEALADLRERALAPLAELRPEAAGRLAETLASWLLHLGRRDEVAAELHVHPQTVRYRMTQLRQLYGDRLNEPRTVLELTVALGLDLRPEIG
ncbi:MAG TPA: helix-turn-helix domain-containing protein [Mycobacteriales bacterium]|nr:helix-turn-helix domain-containing protein [Mycobacteriales bacterium]